MILNIDSDAAYLVLPQARSWIAGYFFLANELIKPPLKNAPILIECKGLRHVVCSSAEAETAALFHNAQTAIPICRILSALGHPQPATPLKTDNSTAVGFVKDNINVKHAKSWNMRMYWLRDQKICKIFKIFWEAGINNKAVYYTKTNHTIDHHLSERPKHILDQN